MMLMIDWLWIRVISFFVQFGIKNDHSENKKNVMLKSVGGEGCFVLRISRVKEL